MVEHPSSYIYSLGLMVNSFEFGGSFPSSIDFVFLHWFLRRRKKYKKKEMKKLGLLGLELRITLFTKEKIDKNWPTLTWEKAKASAESCVTWRCCELRGREHHGPLLFFTYNSLYVSCVKNCNFFVTQFFLDLFSFSYYIISPKFNKKRKKKRGK